MLPELIDKILSVNVVAHALLNPAEAISALDPLAVTKIKEFVSKSVAVKSVVVKLSILPIDEVKSSEILACVPKIFVDVKLLPTNRLLAIFAESPTVKLSDILAPTKEKF